MEEKALEKSEPLAMPISTWIAIIALAITLIGCIVGTVRAIEARPTAAQVAAAVREKTEVVKETAATKADMAEIRESLKAVKERLDRIDTRLTIIERQGKKADE